MQRLAVSATVNPAALDTFFRRYGGIVSSTILSSGNSFTAVFTSDKPTAVFDLAESFKRAASKVPFEYTVTEDYLE